MGEIREDIIKLLLLAEGGLSVFYFIGMWLGTAKYRRSKRNR